MTEADKNDVEAHNACLRRQTRATYSLQNSLKTMFKI